MRRPYGIRRQTGEAVPVLPYAQADSRAAGRWSACRVLPAVLAGSLMGWIVAVNIYGLAYGSISRVETAAAFFLALLTSSFAYAAEIFLLCTICGPRVEPRDRGSVLALVLLPPACWLLLARAQLLNLDSQNILLLLLLGSVLAVPFLVVRPRS